MANSGGGFHKQPPVIRLKWYLLQRPRAGSRTRTHHIYIYTYSHKTMATLPGSTHGGRKKCGNTCRRPSPHRSQFNNIRLVDINKSCFLYLLATAFLQSKFPYGLCHRRIYAVTKSIVDIAVLTPETLANDGNLGRSDYYFVYLYQFFHNLYISLRPISDNKMLYNANVYIYIRLNNYMVMN